MVPAEEDNQNIIEKIDREIHQLERQLTELRSARSVVQRIQKKSSGNVVVSPAAVDVVLNTHPAQIMVKNGNMDISARDLLGATSSLSDAVRAAIRTPKRTADVVAFVKQHFNPDAKPHSIRSILSQLKTNNQATNDGGVWAFVAPKTA